MRLLPYEQESHLGIPFILLYLLSKVGWQHLWSSDGRYVAVGGQNMAAEVWRVWQGIEELVEYARECRVFRDLTMDEREQYGLVN